MKIAHIFWSLNTGGIETLLVNTLNYQVSKGFNVTLILIEDKWKTEFIEALDPRITKIFLGRKSKKDRILPLLKLNIYVLLGNFDIIHIHSVGIGNFLFPYFLRKSIVHVHATHINIRKLPKAKMYIAISNAVKIMLEQKYQKKDVVVIYNGINFNRYLKKENYKISNKIICLGRINLKIKNQDGLIYEFSKVSPFIDADLHIIGDGPDSMLLRKLIQDLKLENRVFLLGNKSQTWIQSNLHEYDLLIQASHHEGLGITAIEASAACLPMILSNVDGHLEISENGKFCELFDSNNEGELALKIINFYKKSEFFFQKAHDSYSVQKEKFSFEMFHTKMIEVYNQMYNDN